MRVDLFADALTDNLQNRLNMIIHEVPYFWERGPHAHFMLHGPSHSERIHHQKLAQLAHELPEDERLSQDEIFIVSAAAWLYEIGMQCTTLRPILDFEWQPGISLSPVQLQQIREKKHLLTYSMIIDSVRRDYDGPRPRLGLLAPDEYTQVIAEVCRWCSYEPIELVPERLPVNGLMVRVRLLVALLRLADQLYIDNARINLDLLQAAQLPPNQTARWWAYHYTQTLPINKGLIKFHYFLPPTHRPLLGHIRALIEPDFERDANPIIRYLWDHHSLKLLPEAEPSVLYDQPSGFLREMSPEMVSYIRHHIAPRESPVGVDARVVLAFSHLVEPFMLGEPAKESELKASLIIEALGLPSDVAVSAYFLSNLSALLLLFDRFFGSKDPNVKGRYAIIILDAIRLNRRQFIERLHDSLSDLNLREDLEDIVRQFFRRVESYVTAEHAKLIHDTTLELVLVSDRTLHSPRQTRLTVEIRNVGEGIADHLVLEVFPVPGKYTVEERHRLHRIDILADKTPIQKELFIQLLVEANAYIELSILLRYDTLKKKDKVAELAASNRTVWLYPESQFVRVRQPYNPGVPATTWFYGRKNQLESMADNLRTGDEADTSMIVYGLKRAGKTSVVRRFIGHTLQTRGLHETHIPIYVDLLQYPRARVISTDGDFLFFLLDVIVRELSRRQISLPFSFSQMREEFQRYAFEAFASHLEAILSALGNQRLLLVVDEFSALYRELKDRQDLTAQLFGFLSNTIQSTHQLTFIFTGTYMLLEMMRTYTYDLAKICQPFMISFLDDTSARQLIMEPVQRDSTDLSRGWLEYDPRVVDRILAYSHCHPYLIQYICLCLVERMNELRYHRVNLSDLDAVITDILMKPSHEMLMLNLWNEFALPQHKVLSVIATLSNANSHEVEINEIVSTFQELGEPIPLDEIGSICESLTDAELLEKTTISPLEKSEYFQITIPLYQMWLKQNKPPRTVFGQRSIENRSY